ncbi:PilT/PilU family type 4a pilus ATPase [Candidatus Gracilibacteria bacterium]|nr:PilT/PilU family type 4a pilus ATPase [Candidatus Gracilibacteria bacterium]
MIISQVLKDAVEMGASDILISAGNFPAIKKSGEIVYLDTYGILEQKDIDTEIMNIIPEKHRANFKINFELDYSLQIEGYGRFRVNAFKQKNGLGLVFRVIADSIPEFDDLNIPSIIKSFSHRKSGLVLITGGVGSGKSTTLASLINEINKNYNKHVIIIEDPIEFVHTSKKSLIEQRELGSSTLSFENGLKYALRQASDVIMVGEMRDLETFRLALRAAETGNLVFATLHTSGAARTVSRIVDMFPGDEKGYIRAQIAESLLGVVWQDLIKKEDGTRVVATEVMVKNKAIENMIREDHIHQINGAIETGKEHGMIPMKKYLEYLLKKGEINQEIFDNHIKKYGIDG